MGFRFDDEQRLFARSVAEFLAKECTPQMLREEASGEPNRAREVALARLGAAGLDDATMTLVLEEFGRAALPGGFAESVAVARPLLAAASDDLAAAIEAGEAMVVISTSDQPYALDADRADAVLVQRGDDLVLARAGSFEVVRQRSLDPLRRLFSVRADDGDVLAGAAAEANLRGALAASAQALGVATRAIELAAAYATERQQFGKAIGEFQLVKGRLADALVAVTFARPVLYRAVDSVVRGVETLDRDVSMAKAVASEAITNAARAALQVHGAIGYTEEHDLHIWLKRAWALANAWGTADEHRARVARAVLG